MALAFNATFVRPVAYQTSRAEIAPGMVIQATFIMFIMFIMFIIFIMFTLFIMFIMFIMYI